MFDETLKDIKNQWRKEVSTIKKAFKTKGKQVEESFRHPIKGTSSNGRGNLGSKSKRK